MSSGRDSVPSRLGAPRPEPWAAMARHYGRYDVLFPIARGGMGEVIAVRMRREHGFEQYFALKRMRDELAWDAELVRVFLDEARLTAAIASPHVVPVVDVGRDDIGAPFLTMELVVGADLRTLRRKKLPISLPALVEIGAQTAAGLDAAHHATDHAGTPLEIVHRDVSPQNILLGVDGRARITDFGIARAKARLAQTTELGLVKGKFGYTAPEQLEGRHDARVDVWALGVVLWEIVVGRPLFTGRSPFETLRNVRDRPIPRLDELDRRVPRPLAEVVARALERDPSRRHRSAMAFARALRGLVVSGVVDPVAATELRALAAAGGAELAADLRLAASVALPELTPERAVLVSVAQSLEPPSGVHRVALEPPDPSSAVTVARPVDTTPLLDAPLERSVVSPGPTSARPAPMTVRETLLLEGVRLLVAVTLLLLVLAALALASLACDAAGLCGPPAAARVAPAVDTRASLVLR